MTVFKLSLQYLLPHHWVSRLMFYFCRIRWTPFKNWQIRTFINKYDVDLTLAERQRIEDYDSFNDFFTRRLRDGARPDQTGADEVMCPADGFICQTGRCLGGRIIQAKAQDFSLHELLGADPTTTAVYQHGGFSNIYLSPRDYHRVHMPIDGQLTHMTYIPGRLFSVAPFTAENIPNLFARNERLVMFFDTPQGPMAMVMVGAMFVSGIRTTWHGAITPRFEHKVEKWDYRAQNLRFSKGDEIGMFEMGSTVILVTPPGPISFDTIPAGTPVEMGQRLGGVNPAAA